ncbi:MAG: glycosyltransferase [Gemmatimonadales bacterium]
MTAPIDSAGAIVRRLVPSGPSAAIDLARGKLPPSLRPAAALSVLDITKNFADTSGGVRTYLLEKARYISARPDLRQVMVLPGVNDAVTEAGGTRCYWLRSPGIPFQKPYRLLLAPGRFHRILDHERPDLIEVGSPFVVPWLTRRANRRLAAPMVWFYHGNVPRIIAPHAGVSAARRGLAGLSWRYVRKVSRIFQAVFAASEFTAHDLETHGVERVIRVPLGVDLELFSPRRRESAAETRRREGWPDGPLAIHIGRLAREKELEVVIEAWAEVERRTGATLVIVGTGPSEGYYRKLARGRRIIWRSFETDRELLADLLAAADLYVAPCPIETFGLAALEAMATGVPVLSVGQGGVAEKVAAAGAGALFPPGDVAAAAEQGIALLHGDLPPLGRAGRRYAEANHAWPIELDAIFAAYRRVLAR